MLQDHWLYRLLICFALGYAIEELFVSTPKGREINKEERRRKEKSRAKQGTGSPNNNTNREAAGGRVVVTHV